MVVFPNAKINLGLRIKSKRPDGYHELDTVFYPVSICDVLEIIIQDNPNAIDSVKFSSTGLDIPGDPTGNLCIKAYHLLKKDFPKIPSIQMHLHKIIPMGAGMGGGSADGAFTISLLNKKFNLGLSNQQMIDYALQLGSDCPFFVLNSPVTASGRGEIMEPITCDLSEWDFLIVNPGIHISTAAAFSHIRLNPDAEPCQAVIQEPIETWKERLINDFEASVFPSHPELLRIKEQLYAMDAVYAAMTGSGSTLFGIFKKLPENVNVFPDNYTCFGVVNGLANRLS